MQGMVMVRLGIMMFLQFFIWGAWYVSMTGFINDSDMAGVTGAAYTVGPLAAILAPFFLGMIADRFFSSQIVLGALHLLGAAFLFLTPAMAGTFEAATAPENPSLFYQLVLHDLPAYVHPFTLLLLLHMLCYMPTLALTTSLSFQNLDNQEKQFPVVRVLGTIGWIVGNIAVSFLPGQDKSPSQFYLAGGAAVLLGLYSFTLPNTPPPLKGKKTTIGQILGTDSLRLFRSPSYSVFIFCSFLICIPLAGYYAEARNFVEASGAVIDNPFDPENPFSATFTMSLGQMSEIFFMLIMPLFFVRLGVKWMLIAGMGAWVLRYGLFALAADDKIFWMILLGVLLHGICYDFFFVTGMIYVDKKSPADIRNQAQGFLVLVTQGLGLGLGAKLFFAHVQMQTGGEPPQKDWHTIWLYPAIFAAAVLAIFIVFFWDRVRTEDTAAVTEAEEELAPAIR